jgi:transcriptional regulator with XRE-family HTH domain
MKFGEIIKEQRKSLNLKQSDLAKKVGVDQCTISRYENDGHDIPLPKLLTLTKELKLKVLVVPDDCAISILDGVALEKIWVLTSF